MKTKYFLNVTIVAYSEMTLVNPPSRDFWESPIRVHYSCVHKVLTCSAFGAIFCLKARAIGSAEFSNGLLVETTCSIPFIAHLPLSNPWKLITQFNCGFTDIVLYVPKYRIKTPVQTYVQTLLVNNIIVCITKGFWGLRETTWDFKKHCKMEAGT